MGVHRTTGPSDPAPAAAHAAAAPDAPAPEAPVELEARNITKDFGLRHVLRGVSLTVRQGELLAIVGASGGGKTVLLDILTALLPPTSGRVLARDHAGIGRKGRHADAGRGGEAGGLLDLSQLSDDQLDAVRLRWAIVFQRNALFSGTVLDNCALWLREHTSMDEQAIRLRVREALKAVQLDPDDVISKARDSLSGGMAKRVAIARAIAADPLVIFYDEPTTGLDPLVGAHVHDLIFGLHHRPVADAGPAKRGAGAGVRTSIIITHDKDLLRRIRPRIVMLAGGRVVFDGPYAAFTSSTQPEAVAYLRDMPVLHGRGTPPPTHPATATNGSGPA